MEFIDGPPAYRDWKGIRWYYNHKTNRYRSNVGIPLAQAVWVDAHGPIPVGHDVHHIDEDTANDDPANLEAVKGTEHRAEHAPENGAKAQGGSAGADAMWAKRQPDERTCEHCAASYLSRSTYSSYCGPNCRAAARRRRQREALGMG
jgi:hypothetical protein